MNAFTLFKRGLLSLLVLNLAACSTLQTVSIERAMQYSPPRGVDYGSLVEIKTLDEKTVKFRVTEITEAGLGGKPGFYRFEDMRSLRVDNPAKNGGNAASYILGALGIIALVALLASADNVSICSPGPCPQP